MFWIITECSCLQSCLNMTDKWINTFLWDLFLYIQVFFYIFKFLVKLIFKLLLFSHCHVRFFATPWTDSTPAFSVLYHVQVFAQTHVHWVSDTIQPSHPLWPSSPFAFNLKRSSIRIFSSELLFASGDQSIAASTSVSVVPMNIHCWIL